MVRRAKGRACAAQASNDLTVFGRIQWSGDDLGLDAGNQSNNDVVGQDVTAYTAYANYKFEGFDILGEYFNGIWMLPKMPLVTHFV